MPNNFLIPVLRVLGTKQYKIFRAVRDNNILAIRSLLRKKPSLIHVKEQKTIQSFLHVASMMDLLDIVKLLLESGANVNATDADDMMPLHAACSWFTSELLLANGANVNAIDKNGRTPLHHASYSGYLPVVTSLVFSGARINFKNNWGQTPYDEFMNRWAYPDSPAWKRGYVDIMSFLFVYEAGIEEKAWILLKEAAGMESKSSRLANPAAAVPQKRLDCPDIIIGLQKVSGTAVAEGMRRYPLGELNLENCCSNSFLDV